MHDAALVLAELRARYTALLAMADANAKAETDAIDAAPLRVVAQRFPGALRELDRVPRAHLEANLDELNACIVPALWMQVTYDFTLQLRAELEVRQPQGSDRQTTIRGRKPSRDALMRTAKRFALSEDEVRALALPDARKR